MFGWLRNRVRDAVLCGVAEAVQELTHGDTGEQQAPVLAQLRLTLAPPATDAPAETPAKGKRKAD